MKSRGQGIDRRRFIKGVGIAAGVVTLGLRRKARAKSAAVDAAAAPVAPAATAAGRRAIPAYQGPPPDEAVLALFGNLRAGSRLGPYTIVAIHGVHLGAIPVMLRAPRGDQFQVDVLKRGAGPSGVGNSKRLSVFLANGGDGRRPSGNEHGLGAMALAAALSRREAAGTRLPSELLTFGERAVQHPRGIFAVT